MRRSLAFVLAFGLAIPGCGGHGGGHTGPKAPIVRFSLPEKRDDITDYEYFTGRTDAVNTVQVRARVN